MHYTLKRSTRARSMRVAVHPGGAIVVTAPSFFGLELIERFLARHSDWVARKVQAAKSRRVIRIAKSDIPRLKAEAREFCEAQCARYAALYGVEYKKITIRAQKTRWGSCSKGGNLSFNYKIAALPRPIAECIVIHEICHLKVFNHSRSFWMLVEQHAPEYREIRNMLRATVITLC